MCKRVDTKRQDRREKLAAGTWMLAMTLMIAAGGTRSGAPLTAAHVAAGILGIGCACATLWLIQSAPADRRHKKAVRGCNPKTAEN